ncbi:glycoside hydrolase family 26 protein [Krasilnikovia sp. MM14-A1259]|uniref:glycoside hydrolase family 26 protein n=1 Tax=Krasilnikovia sp. MM14-A1259 TaxID=3373539 RepID=UPI00399C98E0
MTAPSSGSPRLPRRGLLTLAALATLPAACSTARRGAEAAPPRATPSTGATTSGAPSASVGPATATARPSASASATPEGSASPSAGATTAHSSLGGPVPFEAGKVKLGAYMSLSGKSLSQSIALRRGQLGREQRIVHVFYGFGERLERPSIGDSTLLVSWHGVPYSRINGGGSDKLIKSAARDLARHGHPVMLRWGWEMNGDWFEWGGANNGQDTAGYIRAWRRMHDIFRAEGADNVAWVWSPNWNSGPNTSWNKMQRYYPGDAYVDWVGVSGYNFFKESPRTLFKPVVSAYGGKKPIIVTETAAVDFGGRSKADWIADLSAYVKSTPQIGGLVWFDTDTQEDVPHNFRIDTSATTLAAYKAMARSARFAG